jgi:O-acetylhomoserine (thiol)-lyase
VDRANAGTEWLDMRSDTLALHAGFDMDPTTRSTAVPIYQTATYGFDSADHAAALFNLEQPGYRYSRLGNPTNTVLEQRVTALEGGHEAMCVSTGQSAIYYAIANLAQSGSNIVTTPQLYGTTHSLFAHHLPEQGITVQFASSAEPDAVEALIDGNTRAIYCESVSNPSGVIADIARLADVAHRNGIPLVVDNTVATPILLQPIAHGADIVVHSLTKFLGGHGTSLGGIIVDGGNFPWARHEDRFPMFNRPDASYHGLVYTQRFGRGAYLARCRAVHLRTTGAVLSPFNAFLILQGIETVAVRMDRHVENASRVARFLRDDARVGWVNYTGFADHPSHVLMHKYLGGRASPLITFGVRGGYAAGVRFYDALALIKRVVNLGDAKSLACHPASTTHRQMPPADQAKAGVTPETIRLSIGIEHSDDIIADLDQALDAACESGVAHARPLAEVAP